MSATSLIAVCVLAFAVVFLVLACLATAIRLITMLFPEAAARVSADAVVVAAIVDSVAAVMPGTVVTRIEEEP